MKIVLKYIGNGGALFNVPARDLTEQDFTERAQEWKEAGWDEKSLVGSGLYQRVAETVDIEEEKTPWADVTKPKGKKKDGE